MVDTVGYRGHQPLVSIGVPVFNAEHFLARALDSLLGQTLSDLELIISDNASTDNTQVICEDYVRRDQRVRYIRQQSNIGAPRNWNVVVHEARGVFFKWASANDYCAPVMLERCVGAMQVDPGIVLCYGRTELVDENEQPIEIYGGDISFEEDRPSERFARVCALLSMNNVQCGVFRLGALRRTRLDRMYPSGDLALMAELALYGRFWMMPDVLLFRRQSRGTFTSMLAPLDQQRVYDPKAKKPMKLLRARRHLDNMVSVACAPISVVEKLRAWWFSLRLICWDRMGIVREFLSLFKD